MSKTFKGRPVVAGTINKGEAVVSHNGVNTLATFQKTALMHDIPIIGKDEVIGSDQNNPDVFGKNLTGKVLCLPQTIGSTTGGMVLYTVCALNMAPAAMLETTMHTMISQLGKISRRQIMQAALARPPIRI